MTATITRTIARITATTLATLALCTGAGALATAAHAAPAPARITEDSAAWDCRTMGNRQCGPGEATAEDGSRVRHGYYADTTPVSEYERRLHTPGRCADATAEYAAWRPGMPKPDAALAIMIECMS